MTQSRLIIQPQKTARGLKFRIEEVEGFHYLCCKGTSWLAARLLHSFVFTMQLICAFDSEYANIRFSHDAAH